MAKAAVFGFSCKGKSQRQTAPGPEHEPLHQQRPHYLIPKGRVERPQRTGKLAEGERQREPVLPPPPQRIPNPESSNENQKIKTMTNPMMVQPCATPAPGKLGPWHTAPRGRRARSPQEHATAPHSCSPQLHDRCQPPLVAFQGSVAHHPSIPKDQKRERTHSKTQGCHLQYRLNCAHVARETAETGTGAPGWLCWHHDAEAGSRHQLVRPAAPSPASAMLGPAPLRLGSRLCVL